MPLSDEETEQAELARLLAEDDSRAYRAMRGKRMHRLTFLLFVPNDGTHDRFLPFSDLRLIDIRKDGTELILEASATMVVITGRHLRSVATAVAGLWCARLDAFDPRRHDLPDDPAAAVIEKVGFYSRSGTSNIPPL
jgi:hypothetical protein